MKRTYTGTTFIRNLEEREVKLYVFDNCKYTSEDLGEEIKVTYKGVTSWDIIEGGEEAEEIESSTDASGVDEFHEYLVLHLNNGETATFRNSHVDMFIR